MSPKGGVSFISPAEKTAAAISLESRGDKSKDSDYFVILCFLFASIYLLNIVVIRFFLVLSVMAI